MFFFFFSSRRRHTRWPRDWSSDVCSSDLWTTSMTPRYRHAILECERTLFVGNTGGDAGGLGTTGNHGIEVAGDWYDGSVVTFRKCSFVPYAGLYCGAVVLGGRLACRCCNSSFSSTV